MFIEIEKLTKSKNTPWKTHHPQNTKKGDVIALCLSYKTHHRCLSKNCLFLSSTFLQIKAFCVVSWVLAALCQVNQSLVILPSTTLRTIKSHCTEGLHFTILSPAFSPPFLTPTELSRVETLWCEIIVSVTLKQGQFALHHHQRESFTSWEQQPPRECYFLSEASGSCEMAKKQFQSCFALNCRIRLILYNILLFVLLCFALIFSTSEPYHYGCMCNSTKINVNIQEVIKQILLH